MKNTTGSTLSGPVTGNAIAYFALWYLSKKYGYEFDDKELAMAMGGALITTLLLELRRMGGGIKSVFNRFFPPKGE